MGIAIVPNYIITKLDAKLKQIDTRAAASIGHLVIGFC